MHHPARRAKRRTRVVAPHVGLQQRAAVEQADGLRIGLQLVAHLHTLFPPFFQEHVAERRCTPQSLLGAVNALQLLINREVPLAQYFENEPPTDDPVAALAGDDRIDEPLEYLSENAWLYEQPHPELYGVGLHTILDEQNAEHLTREHVLLIAMWHMARPTAFGPGVDTEYLCRSAHLDDALMEVIARLPQLPADTTLAQLAEADPGLGSLVAYACAATGNPFADYTDADLEYLGYDRTGMEWETVRGMAADVCDAQAVAKAFREWEQEVAAKPHTSLPLVAKHLVAMATKGRRMIDGPRTAPLMELAERGAL